MLVGKKIRNFHIIDSNVDNFDTRENYNIQQEEYRNLKTNLIFL